MVKNINTELTYRVLLQIIAGDATENQDYSASVSPIATIDFPPNQLRLQVFGGNSAHDFEILHDGLPEGDETVVISSEPVNDPIPAYTRPQSRAVTTIFILDSTDSKKNKFQW